MRERELEPKKFGKVVRVDQEDYDRLSKHT